MDNAEISVFPAFGKSKFLDYNSNNQAGSVNEMVPMLFLKHPLMEALGVVYCCGQ